VTCIQERLFDVGEMAISMREFVQAKLEGFSLRQAARAEKRKRQREKRNAEPLADLQVRFMLEATPEERKAQRTHQSDTSNRVTFF
jgi:hypothetical protein